MLTPFFCRLSLPATAIEEAGHSTLLTLHSSLELGRLGRPRDGPHTTDLQCLCSLGRRDGPFTPGRRKEISSPSLDRPLRTVWWTILTNRIQPNLIEPKNFYFSESKSGK